MDNITFIEKTCPCCKATTLVKVDKVKYDSWKEGNGLIQNIMPEFNPADRETLVTGLCNTCQNDVFEEPEV